MDICTFGSYTIGNLGNIKITQIQKQNNQNLWFQDPVVVIEPIQQLYLFVFEFVRQRKENTMMNEKFCVRRRYRKRLWRKVVFSVSFMILWNFISLISLVESKALFITNNFPSESFIHFFKILFINKLRDRSYSFRTQLKKIVETNESFEHMKIYSSHKTNE